MVRIRQVELAMTGIIMDKEQINLPILFLFGFRLLHFHLSLRFFLQFFLSNRKTVKFNNSNLIEGK